VFWLPPAGRLAQKVGRGKPTNISRGVGSAILLVQPGGKKNPFCLRPYWDIITPYAQIMLPKE